LIKRIAKNTWKKLFRTGLGTSSAFREDQRPIRDSDNEPVVWGNRTGGKIKSNLYSLHGRGGGYLGRGNLLLSFFTDNSCGFKKGSDV